MESLRSLFADRIEAARNNIKNTLGFQPVTEALDDVEPCYAIVFPKEVYANTEQRDIVKRYVSRVFADHGLDTVQMHYKDNEAYDVDHYGSRYRTLHFDNILEFVVTVRLEPIREGIGHHIPNLPTWSILSVNYNDFRAELESNIGFYGKEFWAVLNSEDKEVHKAQRSEKVLQMLKNCLNRKN